MNLIILGKGRIKEDIKYDSAVTQVWTVGTSDYPDADLYFEFHDIPVNHPVGLPSALGNLYDRWFHKSWDVKRSIQWYYSQPWEAWADRLGCVVR